MASSNARNLGNLLGASETITATKLSTEVSESLGGGIDAYDSAATLPLTGNDIGDQAYVQATNRLYLWNGTGWFNIALINTNPSITGGADAAYELAIDGTPTVLTLVASDPEGLPITWSYSVTSGSLGSTATVSQADNVFTVTPSTNEADAGTFSITFTASDGVNLDTAVSAFTLEFITFIENSKYTTALITSVGSNGGTNSTVTDSSTNNHTVTVNGNTSSQTFSPYRSGGYSYYFDGSGDYLSSTIGAIGTDDFTFECWANFEALGANRILFSMGAYAPSLYYRHASTEMAVYHGNAFYLSGFTPEINTWYHFAFTREGTTSRLFVNGTQYSSASYSSNITDTTARIGYDSIDYMKGWISDARIVVGTALYTSNFTPPTERLTAVTNTSLLTCHLPYIADGSTNDHSITVNGNVSAKPLGPYDYTEYDSATHGDSIYFDGSGDSIYVAYNSSLDVGNTSGSGGTIEFWYNPTSLTSPRSHLFGVWGTGGQVGWTVDLDTNGNVFLSSNGQGNTYTYGLTKMGTWHFCQFVFGNFGSGFVCKGYLNGVLKFTSNTLGHTNTNSPLYIGGRSDNTLPCHGYISNFRVNTNNNLSTSIPTEPLTAITNTSLLISADASIIDKSQTQSLTLVGNTQSSTTITNNGSSSMYFDGSGDYIRTTIDGGLGSGDFTIEGWVYHTAFYNYITWVSNTRGTTGFNLGTQAGGNVVWYDQVNGAAVYISAPNGTLSLNTWHHFAVVRSNGVIKCYIDGTKVGSDYTTSANFSASSFSIGDCEGASGEFFNGYLEDVRITKGLARYTANFTPPTASLEG